ncbi:MAG: bifunctional [glutamate--ammonia ligase]-adenylyl-L-tyrosine phosphorylase/[glutamate--ammonia-ligase] adenylyltransferase [Rhodoferax sp.]
MTRPDLAQHSRFTQRVQRRYAEELTCLPPGVPGPASLQNAWSALQARGLDVSAGLRVLRALVLHRVLTLDCQGQATLAQVTQAMTDLAEFAVAQALQQAQGDLDAVHGAPQNAGGQRATLWVVGMGKLGARELNVSSDIDLIYVYDEDGETLGTAHGRGRISNHEYFAKVVRAMQTLLADTTEHGFVFRVDLALRPNGNSGPPAVSLDALEQYLHVQGREWERFAWLKSRVIAPQASVADGSILALRQVVMPFVFRRYLDYSVFDSLRSLHRQIRDHASKRSAGRPERANDVKLSRGGIREIEFIVQLLQVVRGGQFPELRTRPTLSALDRLTKAGLMPADTAARLAQAYVFLRQVEHRIQYLDDQQTHILPTADADLGWIAHTLALPDAPALLAQLDTHRELVAQEFDTLLGGAQPPCKACQGPSIEPVDMEDLLAQLPPGTLAQRMQAWRSQPRVLALREDARKRVVRLLWRTAQWVTQDRIPEAGAVALVDWMDPLLRRESYLALLLERPQVHERLLHLLGSARWAVRYLTLHPGVIDELALPELLETRLDAAAFEADLEARRLALRNAGEDDEESLLNLLRRAHHAEVFRTLTRDLEGRISVEQVADDLSALADAVLRVSTRWCWSRLKSAHRPEPRLGIIGYGKLGGKELGYGSDLDLVFVFDDDDERAPEVYAALVRKLINWLTVKTGEGDLYEIDTALRPNGNAGLLITRFDAYAAYQQQRGSNTAWTWEHQAITRARCVLGDESLRARFDAVRHAVITAPRDPEALRDEIRAMRERVAQAHRPKPNRFDLKYDAGGLMDAEFVMQYLVLSHAGRHPELVANAGNIALLERAEALGLLPQGVGHAAASAYRRLRQEQHHARLNETSAVVDDPTLSDERSAIRQLWDSVF